MLPSSFVASLVASFARRQLTDLNSGVETELKAGDCATLEKGSSVRWEIVETVRKFFVIAKGD